MVIRVVAVVVSQLVLFVASAKLGWVGSCKGSFFRPCCGRLACKASSARRSASWPWSIISCSLDSSSKLSRKARPCWCNSRTTSTVGNEELLYKGLVVVVVVALVVLAPGPHGVVPLEEEEEDGADVGGGVAVVGWCFRAEARTTTWGTALNTLPFHSFAAAMRSRRQAHS
jgi:hypothetical protein